MRIVTLVLPSVGIDEVFSLVVVKMSGRFTGEEIYSINSRSPSLNLQPVLVKHVQFVSGRFTG